MAKKKAEGYLSGREARRIAKENRRITNAFEKQRKRKNVPESEYLTQMADPNNAVEFDNLHTYFYTDAGVVKSVDGVSFEVPIGKTVGVVGESGCGKSVTSLSLMQLLQRPQGQVVEGEIRLNLGDKAYDVTKMPNEKMQHLRGNNISRHGFFSVNALFYGRWKAPLGAGANQCIDEYIHAQRRRSKEQARTIGFCSIFSKHCRAELNFVAARPCCLQRLLKSALRDGCLFGTPEKKKDR